MPESALSSKSASGADMLMCVIVRIVLECEKFLWVVCGLKFGSLRM